MEKVFVLTLAMIGGGGERHSILLANGFAQAGHPTCLVITHQHRKDAVWYPVCADVDVVFLPDLVEQRKQIAPGFPGTMNRSAAPMIALSDSDEALIENSRLRYALYLEALRELFGEGTSRVIALVRQTVELAVLAVGEKQRLFIGEAANPQLYMDDPLSMALIRREYPKAAHIVFQSPGAAEWYAEHANMVGTVIPNPLTPDLPEPWSGERTKEIVNFCRFAPAKNLPLLVRAFALLHQVYPAYRLVIYGHEAEGSRHYITYQILRAALEAGCADFVDLRPFDPKIHDAVKKCAMFVSSSDTEGLSNSMIEAMAIGLPTICTDCPVGGARYIIEDHENGLLTPVGDVRALYEAMREVIESPELSAKLSRNGVKVRQRLDEKKITRQWIELTNGYCG